MSTKLNIRHVFFLLVALFAFHGVAEAQTATGNYWNWTDPNNQGGPNKTVGYSMNFSANIPASAAGSYTIIYRTCTGNGAWANGTTGSTPFGIPGDIVTPADGYQGNVGLYLYNGRYYIVEKDAWRNTCSSISQAIVVWQGPAAETWSSMSTDSGWYDTSGWSPDPSTVPAGQGFTQSKNQKRDYHTWEQSNLGNTRNHSYWSDTRTITQGATGTQVTETWAWEYWWTGWYATSSWSPDVSTVPAGQSFTQTRNIKRDQYGRERSNLGNVRNDNTYITSQYSTESQTATGTQPVPVSRSVTAGNPGTIYAGQSFTVPLYVSTTAADAEQIGFFYAAVSLDGGANFNTFAADVNVGKSATRFATGTAGAVGSQIVVRVMPAFRGGAAGDVDYNGTAINWGGSWGTWGTPPAKYFYYTVANRLPLLSSLSATPASINFGQNISVSATLTDPDSNLARHGLLVNQNDGAGWRRPTGADYSWWNMDNASNWVSFTGPLNGVVSGSSSTISGTYRPSTVGTMTVHSNGNDAINWASENGSSTIYAYVTVNKTTPTWSGWANQSRTGIGTFPSAFTAAVANPYSSAVATPSGAITYSVTSATGPGASPTSGAVTASTNFGVGTYQITANYAGDANYNATSLAVTFTVANSAPNLSATLTPTTINFGQTVTWNATATDPDGNLTALAVLTDATNTGTEYRRPTAVDYNAIGWMSYTEDEASRGQWTTPPPSSAASGSSSTKSGVFRPNRVTPAFLFTTYATDGIAAPGAWPTVAIQKATPTGTFGNGSKTPQSVATYSVQASDLGATFINPYSSAVTTPSGIVTYAIAPGSPNGTAGTAIANGTSLPAGLSYLIRASYPGDTNYNVATADSTWTVPKGNQTITFANPGTQWINTIVTLTATASSGLPVTFSIVSGGGSLSGATYTTPGAAATVTLRATQAGNANTNGTMQDVSFQVNVPAAPTVVGSRTNSGTIYAGGGLNLRVVGTSTNSLLTRIGYRIINPDTSVTSPIYYGPVPKTNSLTQDWATVLNAIGHYQIQAWAEDSVGQNTGWILAFEVDVVPSSYSATVQAYSEPAPGKELWFIKSATVNATFQIHP